MTCAFRKYTNVKTMEAVVIYVYPIIMDLPVPVLVSIGVKHVNTIAVVQIHVVMVHVRILEMAATTARAITDTYYQIVRLSVSVTLFQEFVKMVELVSTKT